MCLKAARAARPGGPASGVAASRHAWRTRLAGGPPTGHDGVGDAIARPALCVRGTYAGKPRCTEELASPTPRGPGRRQADASPTPAAVALAGDFSPQVRFLRGSSARCQHASGGSLQPSRGRGRIFLVSRAAARHADFRQSNFRSRAPTRRQWNGRSFTRSRWHVPIPMPKRSDLP